MDKLHEIRSLNDFHRHGKRYAKQLAKTGRPAFLTLGRDAKMIVQDATAYRNLVRRAGLMQSLEILNKRLNESRRSPGLDLAQWNAAMRKKYAITGTV
jgi:hypothetical protein